jgi:hypothetical protein
MTLHRSAAAAAGLAVLCALSLATTQASADTVVACGSFTCDVSSETLFPGTTPTAPFALVNLPSTGSSTINNPGGGIQSITFSGGSPASGVYSCSSPSQFSSPFGSGSTTNYLVAGGTNGAVTVNYLNPQTSLDLIWGTVDAAPQNSIVMTLTGSSGTETITGSDILTALGLTNSSGDFDIVLAITGLSSFQSVTFSDTGNPAFEFALGVAQTPLPAALPLFAAGLGALGLVSWRKKRTARSLAV